MIRFKRVFGVLLSVVMAFSVFTVCSFATETVPGEQQEDSTVEQIAESSVEGEPVPSETGYSVSNFSVQVNGTTAVLKWQSDYITSEIEDTNYEDIFSIYLNDEKQALDEGPISFEEDFYYVELSIADNTAYSFFVSTSETSKSDVVTYVPAVRNLKGVAGYRKVLLKWDSVVNASKYYVEVYRNSKLYKKIEVKTNSYNASTPDFSTDGVANSKYYTYKFNVYVFKDNVCSQAVTISKNPVRPMLITAKAKTSKAITRSGKRVVTLKKGQTFVSAGFNGGRLKPYIRGNRCSFPLIYSKSNKGSYISTDYSVEEKEKFVNDKGLSSGTKYLIWVSQYTQRVNFFVKENGRWKYVKNYRCSSGKASTPTAVGDYKIHKKMRSRHGIPYWTSFYSNMSIHTKPTWKSAKVLGSPKSGGCVRVEKPNAYWVYKNIGKGTRLITY